MNAIDLGDIWRHLDVFNGSNGEGIRNTYFGLFKSSSVSNGVEIAEIMMEIYHFPIFPPSFQKKKATPKKKTRQKRCPSAFCCAIYNIIQVVCIYLGALRKTNQSGGKPSIFKPLFFWGL